MIEDLDPVYVYYALAAAAAVLVVEAAYLLLFSAKSYRDRVNRRLRVLQDEPDRRQALVRLRRERGLSPDGLYRLPVLWLNRLVLQSGLTLGMGRLALGVAVAMAAVFAATFAVRQDPALSALAAVLLGSLIPVLALQVLRGRRHAKFAQQFPDAVDIIVRSLRAGHPVPVAISMVAREMPDPVGTEFGMVADEVTYGADLEGAMRNLLFRVGQDDLPLFVTAVSIQGSTGGNLSEILDKLSRVIRERFKMRRKVRALSSEGRFSALILSSLPFVVLGALLFVAPEHYGDDVWSQPITKQVLGGAAAWMGLGNLLMFRMVNFRI